jgi:hypothetical protein
MQIFDGKYKQILSEGLIRSYNSRVYIKLLERILIDLGVFGAQIHMDNRSSFYHGDHDRMIIYTDRNIAHYKEIKELNRVCGYVVVGVNRTDRLFFTTVEKVFPQDQPLDFENVKKFFNIKLGEYGLYHVTRTNLVPKIKRIGLTPRNTQTSFNHPGNRIYLFFCYGIDNLWSVKTLAKILAKNKSMHNRTIDLPMYSIFKIKPTEDMKFYFDPSLSKNDGFNGFGVFTSQNIPPENITEVDRIDPEEFE